MILLDHHRALTNYAAGGPTSPRCQRRRSDPGSLSACHTAPPARPHRLNLPGADFRQQDTPGRLA